VRIFQFGKRIRKILSIGTRIFFTTPILSLYSHLKHQPLFTMHWKVLLTHFDIRSFSKKNFHELLYLKELNSRAMSFFTTGKKSATRLSLLTSWATVELPTLKIVVDRVVCVATAQSKNRHPKIVQVQDSKTHVPIKISFSRFHLENYRLSHSWNILWHYAWKSE
jgi:hypothetical protein